MIARVEQGEKIVLGFLSGVVPFATGIGASFVGIAGVISVFKAVYIDKMALNCACVGGNSKAPLGIVSFAENAIMATMGMVLIFSSLMGTVAESRKQSETLSVNISMNYEDTIDRILMD